MGAKFNLNTIFSCARKVPYETRAAAEQARKSIVSGELLKGNTAPKLNVYRCVCQKFHVGSQNPRGVRGKR